MKGSTKFQRVWGKSPLYFLFAPISQVPATRLCCGNGGSSDSRRDSNLLEPKLQHSKGEKLFPCSVKLQLSEVGSNPIAFLFFHLSYPLPVISPPVTWPQIWRRYGSEKFLARGSKRGNKGDSEEGASQETDYIQELLGSSLSCPCLDLILISKSKTLSTEVMDELHPGPTLTTEWCTCETNLSSTIKALKIELTLESQTTKGGLEL